MRVAQLFRHNGEFAMKLDCTGMSDEKAAKRVYCQYMGDPTLSLKPNFVKVGILWFYNNFRVSFCEVPECHNCGSLSADYGHSFDGLNVKLCYTCKNLANSGILE